MRSVLAVLSSLVLFTMGQASASDWSAYKEASVAQAWAEALVIQGTDYTIEAANVKYTVQAEYTGQHRELVSARKELLSRWARSLGYPTEYATMFEHEVQIKAGKQVYWLPIQNSLVAPFAAETMAGSRVRLRIMYIGATGQERVFVVNSFQVLSE